MSRLCSRPPAVADETTGEVWMRRSLRRRGEGGAAAVEFALVMPLLLVLVFGIIQYGWYFYAMQAGSSAVGDAARRVAVGNCQTTAQAQTLIYNKLGCATTASSSSGVTTTVTYTNLDGTAD